ncbi:ATP-binding protein [Mycoplasmatota bacterium]|nr:ATP-binding protein [Mycoplasmatota bacterium]
MLLQLSVENFKSIQKQIVFSMLATEDKLHETFIRKIKEYTVLPSAIIMGTNGAGKSNLFMAIKYLQSLLTIDEDGIPVFPHLLSDEKEPTQIDVHFLLDGKRVVYGIDVCSNQVVSEFLSIIENNQVEVIFERDYENYKFNPSYEIIFNEISQKQGSNQKLLLPILNQYSDNFLIKQIFCFLTKNIVIELVNTTDDNRFLNKAIDHFKELEKQKLFNQLLKKIDIGINSFEIKDGEIFLQYENMEINLLNESTGTKKLFSLLVFLSDALIEGKVIIFDEFEKHLHQALVQYFIHLFNDSKINTKNAQLILSTHHTSLLNLSQFRRDQVWFIEKDLKTTTTECYSLYNIEDVKSNENIEQGYIQGKYGATYHFKHGGVKKDGE